MARVRLKTPDNVTARLLQTAWVQWRSSHLPGMINNNTKGSQMRGERWERAQRQSRGRKAASSAARTLLWTATRSRRSASCPGWSARPPCRPVLPQGSPSMNMLYGFTAPSRCSCALYQTGSAGPENSCTTRTRCAPVSQQGKCRRSAHQRSRHLSSARADAWQMRWCMHLKPLQADSAHHMLLCIVTLSGAQRTCDGTGSGRFPCTALVGFHI